MIKINNLISNRTNFLSFKKEAKQNNKFASFNNLAPLKQDTISFKGVMEYRVAINNGELCNEIHNEAKPVNKWLESVLHRYFDNDVWDAEKNPLGTIEQIQARVKSADSIEEKISDKIRAALESKTGKTKELIFSPSTEEDIKKNIQDISGGRIVIKNAFGNAMDRVVENLCAMISNEKLIINQIEYHRSKDSSIIPYFTKEQLEKIETVANNVRKNNKRPNIEVEEKTSKSGYMALHLIIDSRRKPNDVELIHQDFYSELQIIGSDVAMLKDIEDFCYKLKKGMNIKSKDSAYLPFEQLFLQAYNDTKNYPDVQEAFMEYTRQAYKAQRTRKPSNDAEDNIKDWSYKYPTIKECGFEGKIPSILDFNILARIKRDCDDLYHIENNTKEILQKINELPKVTD